MQLSGLASVTGSDWSCQVCSHSTGVSCSSALCPSFLASWWTQPLLNCSQLVLFLPLAVLVVSSFCSDSQLNLAFWNGCGGGSPAHAGTSPDELFLPSLALVKQQRDATS